MPPEQVYAKLHKGLPWVDVSVGPCSYEFNARGKPEPQRMVLKSRGILDTTRVLTSVSKELLAQLKIQPSKAFGEEVVLDHEQLFCVSFTLHCGMTDSALLFDTWSVLSHEPEQAPAPIMLGVDMLKHATITLRGPDKLVSIQAGRKPR